jgi:hypothetical protein
MSSESSVRTASRDKSRIEYRADGELVQADPADALRSVQGVGGDPRTLDNKIPAGRLPGYGEMYDSCGDDIVRFCSGCGETHTVGDTCRRKECPRCGAAWCVQAATAAGSKLEATRRYLATKRGQSPRFHHLVFSVPDDFAVARDDPLEAAFEIVKNFLDQLGTDGGVIIPHPYRGKGDDDRGFWKTVQFSGNDWEETREQIEYSPHFHVIALGRFVPGEQYTQKLYERTGWTFKRITKGDSNVSLYDEYDLARALSYSFSHALVDDGHDSYRYFGRVANFAADDHIEEEINAAVRSVAPNTLGLSYSTTSCTRSLDEDEETAGESGTAPNNADPEMADDRDDQDDDRRCGGRLLHIREAPRYLKDREWVGTVEHAASLARAYRRWLDDRPPPD